MRHYSPHCTWSTCRVDVVHMHLYVYISPVWSHCSPIAVGGAIRNGLVSRKTASTRTCAEKVRRRSKLLDSLTSETKQMLLHAHGDLHNRGCTKEACPKVLGRGQEADNGVQSCVACVVCSTTFSTEQQVSYTANLLWTSKDWDMFCGDLNVDSILWWSREFIHALTCTCTWTSISLRCAHVHKTHSYTTWLVCEWTLCFYGCAAYSILYMCYDSTCSL